jgi:hypothetical protein
MPRLSKQRLFLTTDGLSRRLGQNVKLFPKKRGDYQADSVEGDLVFYPDSFAVMPPKGKLVPIAVGDTVAIRVGRGKRNTIEPIYMRYVYTGVSHP